MSELGTSGSDDHNDLASLAAQMPDTIQPVQPVVYPANPVTPATPAFTPTVLRPGPMAATPAAPAVLPADEVATMIPTTQPTIQPVSTDIPVVQPLATATPPESDIKPVESAGQFQDDPQLPPKPFNPYQKPAVITVDKGYTYRLPVFSYILVAFYAQLMLLQVISLVFQVYNASDKKFAESLAFYQLVVPTLNTNLTVASIILAVIVLLIVLLLIGKVWSRVFAWLIAIASLGYIVYYIAHSMGVAKVHLTTLSIPNIESIWLYYIVPYVAYIIVLTATIIHLLRPSIKKAYR